MIQAIQAENVYNYLGCTKPSFSCRSQIQECWHRQRQEFKGCESCKISKLSAWPITQTLESILTSAYQSTTYQASLWYDTWCLACLADFCHPNSGKCILNLFSQLLAVFLNSIPPHQGTYFKQQTNGLLHFYLLCLDAGTEACLAHSDSRAEKIAESEQCISILHQLGDDEELDDQATIPVTAPVFPVCSETPVLWLVSGFCTCGGPSPAFCTCLHGSGCGQLSGKLCGLPRLPWAWCKVNVWISL